MNSHTDCFSPDAFVERLREIRKATGRTGASIATNGGITKQTFSGYLHTGRLPSANVLANWVFRLGINANWLLTGEGPMLLEQTRLEADPLMQRVARTVADLRQAKAEEYDILRSVVEMLEAELELCQDADQPCAPNQFCVPDQFCVSDQPCASDVSGVSGIPDEASRIAAK